MRIKTDIIKTKTTVKDSATQTDQLQGTKDAGTQTDTFVETKKEEDEENCIKFLKALEQRFSEWYPILLANMDTDETHAKELRRVLTRDLYFLIVTKKKGFKDFIKLKDLSIGPNPTTERDIQLKKAFEELLNLPELRE